MYASYSLGGMRHVRMEATFRRVSLRTSLPSKSLIFDLAVALAATAVSLGLAISLSRDLTASGRGVVIAVLVVHTMSLVGRRLWTWPAFGVNLLTAVAIVALGMPPVVLHFAPLIALYSVSAQMERRRSLWALVASVAAYLISSLIDGWREDLSTVLGNLLALAAVWAGGNLVYARQVYIRQLEARTRELEAAREELAQKVAAEERIRIARELHDVVAHSLSVIAVQSGVGAHVMDADPAEARRSLQTIEEVSRQALREMRGLLTVLRSGEEAAKVPLPSVDGIEGLVAQISASGPEVDLQFVGRKRPVDPSLGLTAYRIVQESLTNVLKHAGARSVRVVLSYQDDELIIDVVDDGDARADNGRTEGHGLIGMRERAEMHGGSLTARALKEGGWGVHARLPIEESR